jgi:hypothetical protein
MAWFTVEVGDRKMPKVEAQIQKTINGLSENCDQLVDAIERSNEFARSNVSKKISRWRDRLKTEEEILEEVLKR